MSAKLPPLVFRADADEAIGSGHLMRCIALAQAWQQAGGEAMAVGRVAGDALRRRLAREGIGLVDLVAVHPDPADRQQLTALLAERSGGPGWLVLDGYHLDEGYQAAMRESGWRLLVIDDLAHLAGYQADILLNQNIYAGALRYPPMPETTKLLGLRFALLRREFLKRRPQPAPAPFKARRLLITLGGADPENATLCLLEAFAGCGIAGLEVKVVVGALNPHCAVLAQKVAEMPNAELLVAVDDMPALLAWADLAVTGAGTTCWELAFLGVPFVTAVLADNQERVAAELEGRGAAVNLGRPRRWQPEAVGRALAAVIADQALRQRLSDRGRQLVDGDGGERVVRAMLGRDFSLRPAALEDCETIFRWANDPLVRTASFQTTAIGWEEHCQWYALRLQDPAHVFYLAEAASGEPMGQVRFAVRGDEAVVSVSLAARFRGLGLGGPLLRAACQRLRRERGIVTIRALIRPENTASIAAFARAGFEKRGEIEQHGMPAIEMVACEREAAAV